MEQMPNSVRHALLFYTMYCGISLFNNLLQAEGMISYHFMQLTVVLAALQTLDSS